jgi:chorismate mutase
VRRSITRSASRIHSAAFALDAIGFDHAIGMQFFRDQIEANKVIQRSLHHRWRRHPGEIPGTNPDLVAKIGLSLEYINTQIIGNSYSWMKCLVLRRTRPRA